MQNLVKIKLFFIILCVFFISTSIGEKDAKKKIDISTLLKNDKIHIHIVSKDKLLLNGKKVSLKNFKSNIKPLKVGAVVLISSGSDVSWFVDCELRDFIVKNSTLKIVHFMLQSEAEKFKVKKAKKDIGSKKIAKIKKLIKKLGSDEWEERENATEELIRMGAVVKPYLKAKLGSKDMEVKWRAKKILNKLKEKEKKKYKFPYIGFYFEILKRAECKKRKLKGGYLITKIIKNTAAEKIKLKANDILIKINGKELDTSKDKRPVDKYYLIKRIFKGFYVGQRIKISILRGKKVLKFTPILGKKPESIKD